MLATIKTPAAAVIAGVADDDDYDDIMFWWCRKMLTKWPVVVVIDNDYDIVNWL